MPATIAHTALTLKTAMATKTAAQEPTERSFQDLSADFIGRICDQSCGSGFDACQGPVYISVLANTSENFDDQNDDDKAGQDDADGGDDRTQYAFLCLPDIGRHIDCDDARQALTDCDAVHSFFLGHPLLFLSTTIS